MTWTWRRWVNPFDTWYNIRIETIDGDY